MACCSAACHWLRNCASFNCLRRVGRAISSAGRRGGSAQEFVIAAEGVFRDVDLWHGHQAPWGPQAVVITQDAEVQLTAAALTAQVPLHTGQIVVPGGNVEGIDHHLGRLIRRQGRQQLAP